MRFVVAFIAGAIISLLVFGFMHALIKNDYRPLKSITEFGDVEFIQPKRKEPPPQERSDRLQKSKDNAEQHPEMPRLNILMQRSLNPLKSDIALKSKPEPLDLATGFEEGMPVLATVSVGGEGSQLMPGEGLIEQGSEQLRPYSSVRPNIPLIAYRKRINGWVILSFTVLPNGDVINITVLDGNPRGIFEEEAVKAVSKWIYSYDKERRAKKVTQRLEFQWINYKENIKNL